MSQIVNFPPKETKKPEPRKGGLSMKISVNMDVGVTITAPDGATEMYRADATGENEGKNIVKWPDTQD